MKIKVDDVAYMQVKDLTKIKYEKFFLYLMDGLLPQILVLHPSIMRYMIYNY